MDRSGAAPRRGAILPRVLIILAIAGVGGAAHSVLVPVKLRMDATETRTITLPPQTDPELNGDDPPIVPDGQSGTDPTTASNSSSNGESLELGQYITLDQARTLWEHGLAQFIDARRADEYAAGHIPRALLCDPSVMYTSPPEFLVMGLFDPATTTMVIYCEGGSCDASENVGRFLQQAGFTQVHIFRDGFPAWSAAGLPTDTGAPTPMFGSPGGL
ncbi:MAG: rhodanese-like domain-containing protein [Phycisphaerales bacterium]